MSIEVSICTKLEGPEDQETQMSSIERDIAVLIEDASEIDGAYVLVTAQLIVPSADEESEEL